MKVLKEGMERICNITCKRCNSELEIDAVDIKYSRACYYIICPNCEYKTEILYIPPHVKEIAKDRYEDRYKLLNQ